MKNKNKCPFIREDFELEERRIKYGYYNNRPKAIKEFESHNK